MSKEIQEIVGNIRLSKSGNGFLIKIWEGEKTYNVSVKSVMNLLDGTFHYANIKTYIEKSKYEPEIIELKPKGRVK